MRYYQFQTQPEQVLDEVRMGSSDLQKFLKTPLAQSMKAGFEAELIFTGLGEAEASEPEYEPDYDYDPRPGNIEEIIDFFQSGDFADLSNRQADRIRSEMEEKYYEWLDEKMMEDWAVDQDGAIRDMIANEEPDLSDEELEDRVNSAIEEQNSDYESALDEYRDDWGGNYDESDWLRDAGIRYMSNAADEFELSWPHYIDINQGDYSEGGFNEENAERLADDLAENLGVKTTVSGGYHSARRDATTWIFEPDGSLDPSDMDDMPVEIVSPPMSLPETVEILPKFFAWAEENGAYANKTTGFHMSVSLPDHASDNIDFTKLALFLGDQYVLESFGRAANTYASSALGKIKKQAKEINIPAAFEKMKSDLSKLANDSLASPSGFGKYTSINPKNNYIEFRSAGGTDYFKDMDKIQNTLMRYAYATTIAGDVRLERNEYAKKLYKLLSGAAADNGDIIKLFSQYSSGEMPVTALKSHLKMLQFKREVDKEKHIGKKIKWRVQNPRGANGAEVVASSAEEALQSVARAYNLSYPDIKDWKVTPVEIAKDEQSSEVSSPTGTNQTWELFKVTTGETGGITIQAPTKAAAEEQARRYFDRIGSSPAGWQVRLAQS